MSGLDIFLIAFSLLSAFLAMIRGFTREVFTLIAWIAAIAIPIYLILNHEAFFTPYIGTGKYTLLALAACLFIIILIVFTYLSMKLSNMLLDSKMGVLESSLGFVFGLARGLVVVAILYIFFSSLVPEKDHPEWITDARSLTLIKGTGKSLISLFPEEPYDVITQFFDTILQRDSTGPARRTSPETQLRLKEKRSAQAHGKLQQNSQPKTHMIYRTEANMKQSYRLENIRPAYNYVLNSRKHS